jgi:pimeloyl-ACP methyl ester carboxylesterase
MQRRLQQHGAARVEISPLWLPDWAIAPLLGFGPVMRRTARAIATTYAAGGGLPVIVVGHSGGGIFARLAMSNVPFNGRAGGMADRVGCLVTLGTPHGLGRLSNRYRHAGHAATDFLERSTPGAWFAPRTSYLSVGSSMPPVATVNLAGRLTREFFTIAVGDETAGLGDGIVPFAAVHLEGAAQLTFDDVHHGVIGTPWYGDDAIIDRWWPVALELWRAALAARRKEAEEAGLPTMA